MTLRENPGREVRPDERFISANPAGSPSALPCDSITSTRPALPAASAQRHGRVEGGADRRARLGEHPVLHQVAQHASQRVPVGPGAFGRVVEGDSLAGAVIGYEIRQPQCRSHRQRHRGALDESETPGLPA
jgi:hypothetical protein